MNQFKDDIDNPELKEAINEFIKQEAIHRVVHKAHGDWLESNGYPAREIELQSQRNLEKALKLNKDTWLIFTVCLEHLTTVFAEHFLKYGQHDKMHPHFRKMWIWHAIEELEHTTVATDLLTYLNIKPNLIRFYSTVLSATLLYNIFIGTLTLLKAEKQLWKWRTLKDAVVFFFNPKHGFHKILKPYFRIMKKDFHPKDQTDLLLAFEK